MTKRAPSSTHFSDAEFHPFLNPPYPDKLSEWHLFKGNPTDLKPNNRVFTYFLNTSLFVDYADKLRTIWMPVGQSASYKNVETLEYPVGTVISKTFFYPQTSLQSGSDWVSSPPSASQTQTSKRLIETRILVRGEKSWTALPYIWNEDQTDAQLEVAGGSAQVSYTHPSGQTISISYLVPDLNQCKICHENQRVLGPIGPKVSNLNQILEFPEGSENQLDRWVRLGYLKHLPAHFAETHAALPKWDQPSLKSQVSASRSVASQARAYLEVHCAHCHNPKGSANTTGLFLGYGTQDPLRLGVCKTPVAASLGAGNLDYDVVPGKPDESILVHRLSSNQPKVMMPEAGRTLVHQEGVALIRQWIQEMPGQCPKKKSSF